MADFPAFSYYSVLTNVETDACTRKLLVCKCICASFTNGT